MKFVPSPVPDDAQNGIVFRSHGYKLAPMLLSLSSMRNHALVALHDTTHNTRIPKVPHGNFSILFYDKADLQNWTEPFAEQFTHNINWRNHEISLILLMQHTAYKYYWKIENDAVFTGCVTGFFEMHARYTADLIARFYRVPVTDHEEWHWVEGTYIPNKNNKVTKVEFVERYSRRFLKHMEHTYQMGAMLLWGEAIGSVCDQLKWCTLSNIDSVFIGPPEYYCWNCNVNISSPKIEPNKWYHAVKKFSYRKEPRGSCS